ncbi:hypothetical protein TanjilG_18163 [Lupinus angustifolius]|uniref:Uncharacterized protein n=1 Tax=Lupinus angustifolius TaxID=3871 RepID=A0A394DG53_LUPAN|nr:PREDICTED: uncharacterized protein LOC109340980 [Lupinus angustifolius]OIW21965.1 hypothetical protein TanjilG_18163 [Lupinus angustifolius]
MDNQQEQGRAHIPGHESHVCSKCGWSYPNPHPSAKQRRSHRKICGSIGGSYDNIVFDDDSKKSGVLVSAPNNLDADKTEKGNDGIGEGLVRSRSEDGVFSGPVADSENGLSPGIKEPLKQDSLDSGTTTVDQISIKAHEVSGSPMNSDFVNDGSQLIVKSSDGFQVGNALDSEGQLSASIVDPSRSLIADLRIEELTFVHSNGSFDLSNNSRPSKAEALSDVSPENKIYTGENAIECSLISVAKETNLIAKDVIKSDVVVVENVDSSDIIVDETCEGVSNIKGSGTISLDHKVADEAVNLVEKKSAEFLSLRAQDVIPLELNSAEITNASTNGFQVEAAHVKQFSTSSDVNILREKEVNGNVDTPPTPDDSPEVAHPQSDYKGLKDPDGVVSQNPLSLHSYESLKHEDAPNSVTKENTFVFNPIQLTEKSAILSPEVHVVSSTSSVKEPVKFDNIETKSEENTEVSPVKLKIESFDRLEEIGGMKAIGTEKNESHVIPFFEEQRTVDSCKDSQQISLPEASLVASSIENPRDASFASATSETIGVISIYHEKNRTEINDIVVDCNNVRANVENDIGTKTKDLQPSDLLQLDGKQSRNLVKSDDVGEMGKIEKCDITETPVISKAVVDGATKKAKALDCTNGGPILVTREDIKEDDSYHAQDAERPVKGAENVARKSTSPLNTEPSAQHVSAVEDNREGGPGGEASGITAVPVQDRKDEISSHVKVHEEYSRSIDPSGDSNQTHDAELLVKAVENLAVKYTSLSLNSEPSSQHDSAAEDNKDGEQGEKVSGITNVPVQDRSVNNLVKHSSSGFDASIDSSSQCDSLEGNQGSVSVISLKSDAPAVIDNETLPLTGSLASTEAGKSNVNKPEESFHKQQTGIPEMSKSPSFMTLVEPVHVFNPKAAACEVEKGSNPQQSDSTSQTGSILTQVINKSPGRKKNEEIIAKVTNPGTRKVRTPLKSLLDEATDSDKAKSSTFGVHASNQENGKFPEHSSSKLKTVNSILGTESPAAQAVKGETTKEWNSPARYPAGTKEEKGKLTSRSFWIQLVCCSSEDRQPSRR